MQRVPDASRGEVLRVIRRDHSAAEFDRVLSILDEYGVEPWERERDRVQLAVLKLAGGRVDEVRRQVDAAKRDYRDALAQAEYPENLRCLAPSRSLSAGEREAMDDRDWDQYARWLARS